MELELVEIELEAGKILRPIVSPSTFSVEDKDGLLSIEIEEIDYPLGAYSLRDLEELLKEHLSLMWSEYAHEPDDNLALNGPRLKQYLLDTFIEKDKQEIYADTTAKPRPRQKTD